MLERREKAAAVRVEELRAEFEHVRAALAEGEEVRELFPAFVAGEGVFDGVAVGGVPVAVAFPAFMGVARALLFSFLGGVIACAGSSRVRPR
ncbi:hypothetical protein ACWCQN_47940 [Streptomyces sp. NPDC001984]